MKKVLISIGSIFIIFLIFVICWVTIPSPSIANKVGVDGFYSSWMGNISDEAKLNEVVIPGSHDSGCNNMIPQARTQGHDIADQLKVGTRYFDIRVTNKGDDLVIFHGPIKGQKFSKVLTEFKEFMDAFPSELIIIDFQHLGGDHDPIIRMLKESLDMSLCLKPESYPHLGSITMKDIRESKARFMVVWTSKNDEERKEARDNGFYVRDEALVSEYNGSKHKESNEALIKEFDNYYSKYDSNRLFVLQAQRTAKTLAGRIAIYEKSFNKHINKYIKDLNNNSELLNKTNIIMRDFIASDIEKVNLILELNLTKGLVKEGSLEEFKSMVK